MTQGTPSPAMGWHRDGRLLTSSGEAAALPLWRHRASSEAPHPTNRTFVKVGGGFQIQVRYGFNSCEIGSKSWLHCEGAVQWRPHETAEGR